MQQFWNERYRQSEYIYGTEPNEYFKAKLQAYQPGKLLLPAEGEGRNAVFAAQSGWQVTAFDWSEAAQRKAIALAATKHVTLNYRVGEINELAFEPASFDAIAYIFAHFPADVKSAYNQKIATFLKPGGVLIFEAFSKKQLEYQKTQRSGGPQEINMLYSIEEVQADFAGFDFIELAEQEVYLAEGAHHSGYGSVIHCVAIKQ